MKLAVTQKQMARAVMPPLAPGDNMQHRVPGMGDMRRYAARFIKPNDRLTSFERLELYNRQYWWRVLAPMREDFPGRCGFWRKATRCDVQGLSYPLSLFVLQLA